MKVTRTAVAVAALAIGLLAGPLVADAQPAGKIYRIGTLSPSPAGGTTRAFDAFRQGLRELGWVEGQNIVFERRYAEGKFERLPELAEELLRLQVDVILATSTPSAVAAKRATSTIPIVIPVSGDPVALGLAQSLARPGGNVTGINSLVGDLGPKQIELLKEIVPRMSRLGFLYDPTYTQAAVELLHTRNATAARQLRLSLHPAEVRTASDLDPAFVTLGRERVQALIVSASPNTLTNRARIVELAATHRLAAIYGLREFAAAGGLISYGASLPDMFRRAALYVDKILRGANPGDLPIEQPTRFELVINLKTAKTLGLAIPQSVLIRADEILQ